MKQYNNVTMNRGQSLIEVLVAIGVFIAGAATVGLLVLDANVSSRQGGERTQAILLAREGLEAVRSLRDADFDNIAAGAHGIALSGARWVFSGASDVQDQFTRTITVTDIDIDTKKIESVVSWQFTEVRRNSVALVDYLTDWNQTHGQGGALQADISAAKLGGGNKRLEDVKIENGSGTDVVIDKMAVWWNNNNRIEKIKIDGGQVWLHDGVGSPDGRQPSGSELDIQNFIVKAGEGKFDIDEIKFNGNMTGTDFIIKFVLLDGSTTYVLIDF